MSKTTEFKVGDEVITTRPIRVIGKGEILSIEAGKFGKVTLANDPDIVIDVYGFGRAIIRKQSIRLLEKPTATANGAAVDGVAVSPINNLTRLQNLEIVYNYVCNLDMQHEMLTLLQGDEVDVADWAELYCALQSLRGDKS